MTQGHAKRLVFDGGTKYSGYTDDSKVPVHTHAAGGAPDLCFTWLYDLDHHLPFCISSTTSLCGLLVHRDF